MWHKVYCYGSFMKLLALGDRSSDELCRLLTSAYGEGTGGIPVFLSKTMTMFKKMYVQSLASVPNAALLVRRTTGPGETLFFLMVWGLGSEITLLILPDSLCVRGIKTII